MVNIAITLARLILGHINMWELYHMFVYGFYMVANKLQMVEQIKIYDTIKHTNCNYEVIFVRITTIL